jgi:hypothetical protein
VSNWSRIVVSWSDTDQFAEGEGLERAQGIAGGGFLAFVGGPPNDPTHSYSCEATLVMEANHYNPDVTLRYLASLAWEYPEEVELAWKHEEADNYETITLVTFLSWPFQCPVCDSLYTGQVCSPCCRAKGVASRLWVHSMTAHNAARYKEEQKPLPPIDDRG